MLVDAVKLQMLARIEDVTPEFYERIWPLLQLYIPCKDCSRITEFLKYQSKATFHEKTGVSPSSFSSSISWLRKWVKVLHTNEGLIELLPLGKLLIQILLHYDITNLDSLRGMLDRCGGLFPAFPGRYKDYDRVYTLLDMPIPEFRDFPYVIKLTEADKYYGNPSRYVPDIMNFVSLNKAISYETLKSLRVAVLKCYQRGVSIEIVSMKCEDNS